MSTPTPSGQESKVEDSGPAIQGHKYDGIREYDNPMPGWWVWLFIVCVAFAPVYMLGINQFGFINTYEEDLAQSQADLEEIREIYAASAPSFETDARALQEFATNPLNAAAGAETFATICAACHGDVGQGLIGPNLTDEFWINGGSEEDIYLNISEGVPANGMPAWNASLSEEEIAQVMAYVVSLFGTNPSGAKEAQGEPYLVR